MENIKRYAIEKLRESRKELLAPKVSELTVDFMNLWFQKWHRDFAVVETANGGGLINVNIKHYWGGGGFSAIDDPSVLEDMRKRTVGLLDRSIKGVDSQQPVRPVLEEHILKVRNTKLSTLLNEYNRTKDSDPNLAAIGFRTILALTIKLRAKMVAPDSKLARGDDTGSFEGLITGVSAQKDIFDSGQRKLLKRFIDSGNKDRFDNVAHKLGDIHLITKDVLEAATELLNQILPSVIEE